MQTFSIPTSLSVKMPSAETRGLLLKIVFGLSLVFVMSLLTIYIIQMGDLTGKSFSLNRYEVDVEALSGDNASLDISSTGYYSLKNMESRVGQLNFVTVDNISYIPIYPEQLVSNIK